jgi:hypothetical protein
VITEGRVPDDSLAGRASAATRWCPAALTTTSSCPTSPLRASATCSRPSAGSAPRRAGTCHRMLSATVSDFRIGMFWADRTQRCTQMQREWHARRRDCPGSPTSWNGGPTHMNTRSGLALPGRRRLRQVAILASAPVLALTGVALSSAPAASAARMCSTARRITPMLFSRGPRRIVFGMFASVLMAVAFGASSAAAPASAAPLATASASAAPLATAASACDTFSDPYPAFWRCTGTSWQAIGCSPSEGNAGSAFNVLYAANDCIYRVWLHQYTYPKDETSGWSACIAPETWYSTIPAKYEHPGNIQISSNTAFCSAPSGWY